MATNFTILESVCFIGFLLCVKFVSFALCAVKFCQLAPNFAFAFRQLFRNLNLSDHVKVAAFSGSAWQSALAQSKPLAALRAGRNSQSHVSFRSRNFNLRSDRRLPWRNLLFVNQVAPFDREVGMFRQANAQEKVPAFSAARSGFALAGKTNPLALMHAPRNFDLIFLNFV